ncbi:MAG: hypothetical protein JSV71_02000 [Nitrospiraceae bacterium]|nr:MAG: hypothetical protein EP227_07315 [bacterium]UCF87506.1 MAG: hypothetical protein JSV71_02000 [Nitrospiraceae bacterium]
MIVRVLYRNEKYDMVKASSLDLLINSRKIKKFKRSEGWAVMGLDRVRGDGGKYKGPERRSCL